MESVDSACFAQLCLKCQGVIDNWSMLRDEIEELEKENDDFRLDHYDNIFDLERSANDGCSLCARSVDALDQHYIDKLRQIPVNEYPYSQGVSLYSLGTSQNIMFSLGNMNDDIVKGYGISWTVPFRQVDSIVEKPLGVSTSSQATLAQAAQWLQQCLEGHYDCAPSESSKKIPTRLLELQENGARLRDSSDLANPPDYVTLSHCWGNVELFKLKRENLEMLRRSIPILVLCKTFQDAIHVTKQLGFRYLWIDSLCIIQDDEDDWRREAVSMASVFGGATLNLAATAAKDGSIGLFFDRDVGKAQGQGEYFQTPDKQTYEILDSRLYERCISRAPLAARAWAFQERHLSRRTLHFSNEQLFWECHMQFACEVYPEGLPEGCGDQIDRGLMATSTRERTLKTWASIVKIYSECQLTYRGDKLVAISGVARSFSDCGCGKYLAGMWREDLEIQLCWAIGLSQKGTKLHDRKSLPYQSPTWSWASTDSPVYYPSRSRGYSTRLLSQVIDVNVSPVGPDGWGQIRDAKLQLRCYPLLLYAATVNQPIWHGDMKSTDTYWDWIEDHTDSGGMLYILPVLLGTGGGMFSIVWGLVIRRSDRVEHGFFIRVGICRLLFTTKFCDFDGFVLKIPAEAFADDSLYEAKSESKECGLQKFFLTLV